MRVISDGKLVLRDGVRLNYDLYMPDYDGSYPVILMRTPYTKVSLTEEGIYSNVKRFVNRDYCVMVCECRGTGKSEGVFEANALPEYDDGYDTVEWIARQDWCDGNVGMFGLSYFGFTQLAAASAAPAALKAICPFMTQAMEPFGSQMTQTFNYSHLGWIYQEVLGDPERFIPDENVREKALPVLKEYAKKLDELALFIPADKNPGANVEGVPMFKAYIDVVRGMEDKAFWDGIRHPTDLSKAHVAMFHCTGWFDVCLNTTIHNWEATMTQGDDYTRNCAKLIIGPWCHGGEFSSVYGSYDFGMENDGCGQDIPGKMLKWFDCYLKGNSAAVENWDKVRYFVLGSNKWLSSASWPPAEAEMVPYYLHENGLLSAEPQKDEKADNFTYDPMNPPLAYAPSEGEYPEPLPDYAGLGSREDVLTYETEPFQQKVTIAGAVRMKLYAATTAADTDFTCRILDVYPDGREFKLTQGLIRAKWRKGFFQLSPIAPNDIYEYDIEVGNVGNCFLPGHKMKIHVSSALFPLYDRNLNTGEPSFSAEKCQIATQTVFHNEVYPSRVMVPVIFSEGV